MTNDVPAELNVLGNNTLGLAHLNAFDEWLEFWTHEGTAGVSAVDVEPQVFLPADGAKFFDIVERADGCSAETRAHLSTK